MVWPSPWRAAQWDAWVGGQVCDWLLRGRRVATLVMVGTISGLSLAILTWLPSDGHLAVVMLVAFVLGITSLGWSGVRTLFLAELAGPDLTGTAIGFVSTLSHIGAFAITPLFGLIVDRTGSYDLAWWMAAGVVGLGTLLMGFLSPQARRQ